MLAEFFIAIWIFLGIVSLVCGLIWKITKEDIFGIIGLICGLLFIAILLLILSSLTKWTGQVIQEWLNQTIN